MMSLKQYVERLLRRCPPAFRAASRTYYALNRAFTTLSPGAPGAILQALQQVRRLRGLDAGDYYEFGVFRGYTLWSAFQACQRLGLRTTRLYGFDSFQGLPAPEGTEETDGQFFAGQFACSKTQVSQHLTQQGIDWTRVELVEGFFDKTLTATLKASRPFQPVAVALIDCDLYSSTRDVLAWLASLIRDGSILLFDDWRTLNDPSLGQQRAFREFLARQPQFRAEPLHTFEDHGQGFIIRHAASIDTLGSWDGNAKKIGADVSLAVGPAADHPLPQWLLLGAPVVTQVHGPLAWSVVGRHVLGLLDLLGQAGIKATSVFASVTGRWIAFAVVLCAIGMAMFDAAMHPKPNSRLFLNKRETATATLWQPSDGPERPMRILRVADKLGYGDRMHGVGRLWLATLREFDPSRYQIIPCVLRLSEGIAAEFERRKLPVIGAGGRKGDPRDLWLLVRLIRRHHVDLLHLEGVEASIFGRVAGLLTGTPAIIHHHDTVRPEDLRLLRYTGWADRLLAPLTVRAIGVSEAVGRVCVEQRGIPADRVSVIPNALELDWAQPKTAEEIRALRQSLGIPEGEFVIGAVTRLWAEKDVPTLVRATARLNALGVPSHLLVLGEGPDRSSIEALIREVGLASRAHLLGFQAEVRPFLQLMDVGVYTGLAEGFSLALLESMAMARAVVVVEGPMTEVVRDGRNGLVVPSRDPERLAQAMARLARDPGYRERLGRQGREDTEQYRAPAHVARMTAFYDNVLTAHRRLRREVRSA